MSATVADRLACALVSLGFRHGFGYLGHHVEPLPQALVRAGCQVLIAASETGAGYMAHGFALAAQRPALVFCSGGPGLAMLVPALQCARLERAPLLAVVGQTGSDGLPRFQDTGLGGSRDRALLEALAIACLQPAAVSAPEAWLPALLAPLAQASPSVLSIPSDILAAPCPEPWLQQLPPLPGAPAATACAAGPAIAGAGAADADPPAPGAYRAVVAALLQSLPPDSLWFGDAGQSRHAMRLELEPRRLPLCDCPNSAPMGWAIAAAIGAACLDRRRPVCCFSGDGSARMLLAEWSTAVQHQLPITFVLARNGVLGGPYARLRHTPAEALSRLPALDWCAMAAAQGLPAVEVADGAAIPAALAGLPDRGPRLLVVPLPAHDPEVVPPYRLRPPGVR